MIMTIPDKLDFYHISTNASFYISNEDDWCYLGSVIINTAGISNTLAVYNGNSTAAPLVASINTTTVIPREFNVWLSSGIFVVTSGGTAADVTITFSKGL